MSAEYCFHYGFIICALCRYESNQDMADSMCYVLDWLDQGVKIIGKNLTKFNMNVLQSFVKLRTSINSYMISESKFLYVILSIRALAIRLLKKLSYSLFSLNPIMLCARFNVLKRQNRQTSFVCYGEKIYCCVPSCPSYSFKAPSTYCFDFGRIGTSNKARAQHYGI